MYYLKVHFDLETLLNIRKIGPSGVQLFLRRWYILYLSTQLSFKFLSRGSIAPPNRKEERRYLGGDGTREEFRTWKESQTPEGEILILSLMLQTWKKLNVLYWQQRGESQSIGAWNGLRWKTSVEPKFQLFTNPVGTETIVSCTWE